MIGPAYIARPQAGPELVVKLDRELADLLGTVQLTAAFDPVLEHLRVGIEEALTGHADRLVDVAERLATVRAETAPAPPSPPEPAAPAPVEPPAPSAPAAPPASPPTTPPLPGAPPAHEPGPDTPAGEADTNGRSAVLAIEGLTVPELAAVVVGDTGTFPDANRYDSERALELLKGEAKANPAGAAAAWLRLHGAEGVEPGEDPIADASGEPGPDDAAAEDYRELRSRVVECIANLARPTFAAITRELGYEFAERGRGAGKAVAEVIDALLEDGAAYHDGNYRGGPIYRLRPDPVPPSAEVALHESRYLKRLRSSGPATIGELAKWGDTHQALVATELSALEHADPPLVRKGPGGKYTATAGA